MDVTISKNTDRHADGPVCINIPPSKSLSHRALIAAALADGQSVIRNLARNDDTAATIRCLRRLGAEIDDSKDPVTVRGIGTAAEQSGPDAAGMFSAYDGKALDCGESASTLRFLLPLFAQSGRRCIFTGSARLMERPQTVYEELYGKNGEFIRLCGAELTECFSKEMKDSFPGMITVKGSLSAGTYRIRGDISSQFVSGLMFLLPLLDGDSVLEILPPFGSASYVDLTAEMLARAGIELSIEKAGSPAPTNSIDKPENDTDAPTNDTGTPVATIKIPGGQRYKPIDYSVPADWSSAAFFAAYSLLSGRPVGLKGADPSSLQADRAILDYTQRPGPIEADLSACPDLGPVLFALASRAEGTSVFRGVSRLRLKESDRVKSMEEELAKLGCRMWSEGDTAWVEGRANSCADSNSAAQSRAGQAPALLSGHNDHRIVMALAVLAACSEEPITIQGAQAAAKSWPGFFEELARCASVTVHKAQGETL